MELLNQLRSAVRNAKPTVDIWIALGHQQEQLRKLISAETKRLMSLELVVTEEKMMALVAALVEVIRRHITDRTQLQGLINDINRLVDGGRNLVT